MNLRIETFLKTVSRDVAYNEDAKKRFHRQSEVVLRRLAGLLGYEANDYELRHNQGGIAVSGEITLHSDELYVMFSQLPAGLNDKFLWRVCSHRKDFIGRTNLFAPWTVLRDLEKTAATMKNEVKRCRQTPSDSPFSLTDNL